MAYLTNFLTIHGDSIYWGQHNVVPVYWLFLKKIKSNCIACLTVILSIIVKSANDFDT